FTAGLAGPMDYTPGIFNIKLKPYKKDNQVSYSYHYPLSAFTEMLFNNGFLIEKMEEWISDKKSEGGRAKIEDKARAEFPLFLAIKAIKNG
ncbi:MAG: Methyltransferase domain protein, partial [Candidatus Shapirobacteria bacterium GW2011_GWE1_38_10]